ncbi:drug resistance transporter [Truncatella angustata]|uniref:Drug resistance transporter n=1 Tax=Truncatella angustata TaxID=152316 RepID=A0A9P8ZZT3_9PEZI|nr:drug resistance transporter [Truncatella angustata]KAH6656538.1 drug resistance transporter [Truncatella angustata]
MEDSLRPGSQGDEHYGEDSLSRQRQTTLVAILLLGLLFSSIDASIISTSLVSISVDLHDFLNSPWVALSYLLAYMGTLPQKWFAILFAKLSDIFGRKALLAAAWTLFAGFSLACGLASDMRSLIIYRAFQGIGGSGLYSLAQIGLFEVGPSDKPSLLGALIGMTLAISFVLGPILGGIITRFAGWRWIFYVNVPFGITALVGIFFAWPKGTYVARGGLYEILRKADMVGNILILSASSFLIYSLQEASTFNYAWHDPVIVLTLSLAAVSWALFISWEVYLGYYRYQSIQPVFPMRLVLQRPFVAALSCSFFSGFAYLAIIIILPERFQIVNGDDSLMAGIHLLPQLGACAFGSFLAGAISSKRNNTAITLILASSLQLIGVGLLSTLSNVLTAIEAQYGYQTIFGLGVGLSFASATILISVRSHPEDLAVAQGAIAQARVFGGAIGIAVCMIIVNTQIQSDLTETIPPEDLRALQHNPLVVQYFTIENQQKVKTSYATAFTDDIKVMICISAAGLIASLFAFELDPPPMPSHTMAKDTLGARLDQSETELDEIARYP